MEKQIRQVKMYSKYRPSQSAHWFNRPDGKEVPWLNVSGHWLRKAGFNIGDAIEITVSDNQLIIKNLGHGDR